MTRRTDRAATAPAATRSVSPAEGRLAPNRMNPAETAASGPHPREAA
jgi:hypothetical protein